MRWQIVFGFGLAALAGCTRGEKDEHLAGVGEALVGTTTCTVGSACSVDLGFPNQLTPVGSSSGELPLLASEELIIADNAQVLGSTGQPAAAINTGTGLTDLGSRARVGALWAKGNVKLRSQSEVRGALYAQGTIEQQQPVQIVGGIQAIQPAVSTVGWKVTFPAGAVPPLEVPPDATQPLVPGRYGDISVKSRAKLKLKTGVYYFESLTVEPQAILNLDNAAGTLVVYVRGQLIHRGSITYTGSGSDLLVGSFSNEVVRLESEFDGSLFAPRAKLVIGTANGATHDGAFAARSIEVQAGARIRNKETSRRGPAFEGLNPTVAGDPSAPLPPAPNTQGLDYDDYQKKMGEYVQTLIDQKRGTAVTPTHPAAQGAQDPAAAMVPPGATVTRTPLPATFSGTVEQAQAEARASVEQARAATQQRLPELDPATPLPEVPPEPTADEWASGFCPLEHDEQPPDAEPKAWVDKEFFFGNLPDPSKTFDAYWNASGHLKAGLDSLYKVYADAAFATTVGVGLNLGIIDPINLEVFGLVADAEAGAIANDGRLFSVPYAQATIKVMGSDVKTWKLPEDVPGQSVECREKLKACQEKNGIYDQCCSHWFGVDGTGNGNRVIDTSNCLADDFCGFEVQQCRDTQTNGAGCINAWSLATQPLKVDLWNQTIDFLKPPISFPIWAFTVYLNGGVEVGVPSYLAIDESGPDLTIAPFGRVFVKVIAEVGAIVYLAVEGQLDLIRLDIPFKSSLKWRFNRSPEVCAAVLEVDANVKTKWSTLNGKVLASLYMKIWVPFVGDQRIEIAKQEVFKWEGFTTETDPWVLVDTDSGDDAIVKLDPASCVLGGNSCAAESKSDHKFDKLVEEGQAFWSDEAPYGQKNCQGQSIVEIPDSGLGTAVGLLVQSTWDRVQTTQPCATRKSQFTVWVQRDDGKNGPSQEPSPYFNWENYDSVTVNGVEQNGTCAAVVSSRRKPLPDSLVPDLGSEPWAYVPLNRTLPSGRVTNVRLVSHATSSCSELPLEYQAVPLYSAP